MGGDTLADFARDLIPAPGKPVVDHTGWKPGIPGCLRRRRIAVTGYSAYVNWGSLLNNGQINIETGSSFDALGGANSGSITGRRERESAKRNGRLVRQPELGDETLTSGTYTLGPGGTLYYDAGSGAHGGAIINIGSNASVQLNGGEFLYGGGFGANALALLAENDGQLGIGRGSAYDFTPLNGTFTNTGGLGVANFSTASVQGGVRNSGNVTLTSAELSASGVYTQTSGTTQIANGRLAASASIQGGTVTGTGIVDGSVDNWGGDVAAEMGNLEVTGDYSQEAGGEPMNWVRDFLKVDGNASLNGIFEGVADFGGMSPYVWGRPSKCCISALR